MNDVTAIGGGGCVEELVIKSLTVVGVGVKNNLNLRDVIYG
jgi:hypothetical protein